MYLYLYTHTGTGYYSRPGEGGYCSATPNTAQVHTRHVCAAHMSASGIAHLHQHLASILLGTYTLCGGLYGPRARRFHQDSCSHVAPNLISHSLYAFTGFSRPPFRIILEVLSKCYCFNSLEVWKPLFSGVNMGCPCSRTVIELSVASH